MIFVKKKFLNGKRSMKTKKKIIIGLLFITAIISVWIAYENTDLVLHILKDAAPDMIAITGDIIDSRKTNFEVALKFLKKAIQIAPCYYVTGNHEARVSEYEDLKHEMELIGVVILENEQIKLEQDEESITMLGLEDPSFKAYYLDYDSSTWVEERLKEMKSEEEGFRILLSHRPELFSLYETYDMDLVLCGHAHGGQIRLPFIGGILAPNQGFFPKYDAGLYEENNTNMIVSRGIGNSAFPFRVNNAPEVILIELKIAY